MSKRDYEDLFKASRKAQMEKLTLPEKIAKGDWGCYSLDYLYKLLKLEEKEFDIEIKNMNIPTIKHYSDLRKEAADIANISGMIIQHCDRTIKTLEAIDGN